MKRERVSVRRESKTVRRYAAAFMTLVAVIPAVIGACNDWPPGDRNSGTGNSSGFPSSPGTCSGTPLSCSSLPTLQCGATSGCRDEGSCSGSATTAGASCLTSSPTECNNTAGCFWNTVCTGTPYGSCSATTRETCVATPGCTWTPAPTGTGGTTNANCRSYLVSCTTAAACDCGYECVIRCPSCTGVCGNQCSTDADCNGTTATGVPTPYCAYAPGVTSGTKGASGICSISR